MQCITREIQAPIRQRWGNGSYTHTLPFCIHTHKPVEGFKDPTNKRNTHSLWYNTVCLHLIRPSGTVCRFQLWTQIGVYMTSMPLVAVVAYSCNSTVLHLTVNTGYVGSFRTWPMTSTLHFISKHCVATSSSIRNVNLTWPKLYRGQVIWDVTAE